jgi:hypothetical protein
MGKAMRELTKLQKEVLEKAKQKLRAYQWYKGVCLDNFPSDHDILQSKESAINSVVCETMYWDAPTFDL